jgi:hypothetical protein
MKDLVYCHLAKKAEKKCDKNSNTASVSIIQGPGPQMFVSLRPGHSGQFHATDSSIHAPVS